MGEFWMNRKLSNEFLTANPNDLSNKEISFRWLQIPDKLRPLVAYLMGLFQRIGKDMTRKLTCQESRALIYISYKHSKGQGLFEWTALGPMYWTVDGIFNDPERVVRLSNGLISWTGDESCKGCLRGKDGHCRYYKVEPEDDFREESP